ncbi:ATP-binding protein (plasmid) [Deinococcus psychrotolerans]|uniref:ATP-binding protein n=1 Tax=Deinococcus psychrotolerans TaxID=2489213 RepID=A0A3G8YS83_9DEIO|nr:tetratricopeptide repeat protein [Deinococcus psychrotolerans]AZI45374.1 ATP-binding protein [Deinococcus psychrotolerans]
MRLRTLGGLSLEGSGLGRPKPLLLLTYLTLEGPQARRLLGELFWPDASNPTNSVAVAVRQIRQAVPGVLQDDGVRVWADLPCDALDFERAVRAKQPEAAFELYQGAFLDASELLEWGTELEEWAYAKREALAEALRETALAFAEQQAALGQFERSAVWVERAIRVLGAPEPDPEFWVRAVPLLLAGESPLLEESRRRAAEWDLKLEGNVETARARLRQSFVGREVELARLRHLPAGRWAWIKGGSGLGKSSLLRQLPGQLLPGRSGLPYATLEPLLEHVIQRGDQALLLRHLATQEGIWLLDHWENMDEESRMLLAKLHDLGTRATVVITSCGEPSFSVDERLDLYPLSAQELTAFPGALEATAGLPSLLNAWLRSEPVDTALDTRIQGLSLQTQRLYAALTLLESPDLPLVRQALDLTAPELALALEELLKGGFVEPSGEVRGQAAARRILAARPTIEAELALRIARQLNVAVALPFFQKARALWEESDLRQVEKSYQAWAEQALQRGFPLKAVEALREAPSSERLSLLHARALERAGQFKEALLTLTDLPVTPEASALKGALYWRLGQPDLARQHAKVALDGEDEARAEALNTLANLDFQQGEYGSAEKHYRRAATLWQTLGDNARWAGVLNNRAAALSAAGEDAEAAFSQALQAAGDNLAVRALTTMNLGQVRERRGDLAGAVQAYQDAASLAEEAGSLNTSAKVWNNLGALYHRNEQLPEASHAYAQALTLAKKGGEKLLLGTILANLAELTGDHEAFEEALRLIEKSGNPTVVARYQAEYQAFIARSPRGAQA